MNPFLENGLAMSNAALFYKKFYNDRKKRHMILGINPGRFGAAVTGVPFTDSKRMKADCGIPYTGQETHELSSVFIYEMIHAYGSTEVFYKNFYINSICPLGFTITNKKGKTVNHNYYDSKELTAAVYNFIVESIQKQLEFGIYTDTCFCFGKGKNEHFFRRLNDQYKFFGNIVALEHPRFIMQYKLKTKQLYIDKYLAAFGKVIE